MGLGDQAPALQGPLNQFVFVRLVFRTFANRSTGCLELRRGDVVKTIYFRRGRIRHSDMRGSETAIQSYYLWKRSHNFSLAPHLTYIVPAAQSASCRYVT